MHRYESSFNDAILNLPFTKKLRWGKSDGDNASSLRRWVGPGDPDNLLHLGENSFQVICIASHNGQVAHTLVWWDKNMSQLNNTAANTCYLMCRCSIW